ncbi:DUF975 family protein [Levilactobacillus bambusae]|uniref:DUF975 domain-containing protein n=1 Tax=Levilactobacillus bambusae TaxID=2024736 RepID=A0A2V1MXL5_9LACO|nr:DUF975 family protein [Levilactobacillus bambusae]PWF99542.1 hypothetical protein DCM90_08855 [Levilactobacillus bambusae]
MVSRETLKRETRNLYSGHWGQAIRLNILPILGRLLVGILLMTLAVLVAFIVASHPDWQHVMNQASGNGDGTSNGGNGVSSFISEAIGTFILVGIGYTSLDWFRSGQAPEKPFREAFSTFSSRYFTSTLAIFILTFIFTTLWSLLFLIPGLIKSISYSQAYNIYKDKVDHGDVSYLDCITESRHLMNGHKWAYFWLQISFWGWGILSLCTFGIGFIWLIPYINGTNINFYRHLVDQEDQTKANVQAAA